MIYNTGRHRLLITALLYNVWDIPETMAHRLDSRKWQLKVAEVGKKQYINFKIMNHEQGKTPTLNNFDHRTAVQFLGHSGFHDTQVEKHWYTNITQHHRGCRTTPGNLRLHQCPHWQQRRWQYDPKRRRYRQSRSTHNDCHQYH